MKKIVILIGLILSLQSFATIENEGKYQPPTDAEIAKSRACWEELERLGCGDPGEDPDHFRACMSNVYSSLTKSCQSLMTTLYNE